MLGGKETDPNWNIPESTTTPTHRHPFLHTNIYSVIGTLRCSVPPPLPPLHPRSNLKRKAAQTPRPSACLVSLLSLIADTNPNSNPLFYGQRSETDELVAFPEGRNLEQSLWKRAYTTIAVRCLFFVQNIVSHACSLQANMRVPKGIHLGCPLPFTVTAVNSVQTLKVINHMKKNPHDRATNAWNKEHIVSRSVCGICASTCMPPHP